MARGSRSGRWGDREGARGDPRIGRSGPVASKLEVVFPEGEKRAWFRQRLLPLLGIEASSSAEREELFTAWRRWLELIAGTADGARVRGSALGGRGDARLLEHLADRAEGVPILIVGTTRPELYERRPEFGGGLRNATPITLAPLSSQETARLVLALLDASVIPAELQQPILDPPVGTRCMPRSSSAYSKTRTCWYVRGRAWELREGVEVPFPDSVRALIAARLDTLTPDAKSLLADAAVIGKVFWVAASPGWANATSTGCRLCCATVPEGVGPCLTPLVDAGRGRIRLLAHPHPRRCLQPTPPRIARNATRRRHLDRSPSIRPREDHADLLADHYATAHDLAHASGQADQAATLEDPARRFLTLAGERALGLDTERR